MGHNKNTFYDVFRPYKNVNFSSFREKSHLDGDTRNEEGCRLHIIFDVHFSPTGIFELQDPIKARESIKRVAVAKR